MTDVKPMGQVKITINSNEYTVGCEDGEEPRVTKLAEYVDGRINKLTESVGQVGEARLLLLATLMIADDLSDAHDQIERFSRADTKVSAQQREALGLLAERLESVADQLETP